MCPDVALGFLTVLGLMNILSPDDTSKEGVRAASRNTERERQRARGRVWSPPSSVDVGECDAASVVLQSGRQRAGPLPSAAAGHTKQLVTDPSGGMTTLHWAACVWERRADTPSVFLLPRPGIPAVLSSLAQPA